MTSSSLPITKPTNQRAYIVLAIGVTAVALAAIFIRLALNEQIPSLLIASGRLVLASLILTPMTLRSKLFIQQIRALNRIEIGLIGISGFVLAIHFWAWVTSLEHTSVLISVVLVTTSPIWVALLEIFFLKAQLTRLIFIGLIITLIGSVVIGLSGEATDDTTGNDVLGAGLSALGALAVAIYLTIGRRLRKKLDLIPYIWLVYGCAAIIITVILLFSGTAITGHSSNGYLWIVALALIPQLIGHSSFNYALAYLPATFVSVTTQVEPIGSAILAVFIFDELPGWGQVIGSAIILGGVILASLGQSQSNQNKALSKST